MTRRPLKWLLASCGALLMALNVVGLFIPLRNAAIYDEPETLFPDDITLTADELLAEVDADPSDRPAYLRRVNDAVRRGMAHYWDADGAERYRLHVPLWENYLLWAARWVYPPVFARYEFSRHDKAIERGVGLCSQHAIVVAGLLGERGIPARIVGLDGHVVATADAGDGNWWILDADYGAVIPHDLAAIERNPQFVRRYYAGKADAATVDDLVRFYGPEGNVVIESVRRYDPRRPSYALRYWLETIAYALKWLLPVALIAPLALSRHASRRGRAA